VLECSEGDNVGETKQMKQKLQEHYRDHIFLSMLKGMKMFIALEMRLSTSSMKSYSPLRTAQTVAKFMHDETLWKKKTANLIQPIEDVSSIIDRNLRIFSLLYRFSLNI